MYEVRSTSITEVGKVRDSNEDAVLETGNLYAVADGMGGHEAGEVASNLAISVIGQYIEDNMGLLSGEKLVEKAISAANSSIYQKSNTSSKYKNMGTTATILYREGDTAFIGHVGDSRAYLFRNSKLSRLTEDHSLVGELRKVGEITEEEARSHPQRNIITRALGLEPRVEVDVFAVRIQPDDKFLLATDGLTNLVVDEEIERVLADEDDIEAAARTLVEMAIGAGGTDNVSIVLISFAHLKKGPQEKSLTQEEEPCFEKKPSSGRKKIPPKGLIIGVILLLFLASVSGGVYYLYHRSYFVGAKDGKIALYHGFPFWGLASIEKVSDMETKFLSESRRRKVEGNLEAESKSDAERTMRDLEEEAKRNSVLVPNVEGKSEREATDALLRVGLKPKIELVYRRNIPADLVINQDPPPGTRLGRGASVLIQVTMEGKPEEV